MRIFVFFTLLLFGIPYNLCAGTNDVQTNFVESSGASTTCADTVADVMCEDWDYADSNSWADVTTDGTVSHTASHPGTWSCIDKGDYAIGITRSADTDYDERSYISIGAQPTGHIHFSVMINDYSALTNFSSVNFLLLDSNTDGDYSALNIKIYKSSSGYYFGVGGWGLSTTTASVTMIEDTMYEIGLSWAMGSGAADDDIRLYINGSERASITGADLAATPSYLHVGVPEPAATNRSFSLNIDSLEVDDDTMPSACPK